MAGMTGRVPYYGGRFTPAQAYAASHRGPPRPAPPTSPPPAPRRAAPTGAAPRPRHESLEALDHLRETGVVDQQEYEQLRARIAP
jgi:hypothetical protein